MTIALLLLLIVFAAYFIYFSIGLARVQEKLTLHMNIDMTAEKSVDQIIA